MKYLISLFCLFLVSGPFISFGQDSGQLRRVPYKLILAVDKKSGYEEDIQATTYVLPNNTIQLYPGEKVYIEIKRQDGKIESLTAVREIKDSSRTVIITFSQAVSKKVHESIMLQIQNPFSGQLTYRARIFLLMQKRWVDTNVYPVQPGLSAFEIWPDIITSIVLTDWEIKED